MRSGEKRLVFVFLAVDGCLGSLLQIYVAGKPCSARGLIRADNDTFNELHRDRFHTTTIWVVEQLGLAIIP